MNAINHYDLSRILGSTIVGNVNVQHGQISANQTLVSVKALSADQIDLTAEKDIASAIEKHQVIEAFLDLRSKIGDRGSPDLYVADKYRNAKFVDECRANGIQGSIRQLNHCLLNARKQKLLSDLGSISFRIDRTVKSRIQFVCEFTASKMRYEFGASIDGILCSPVLANTFHDRCSSAAPGYSWLDYRWTILSARKAGSKPKPSKNSPPLDLENHPIALDKIIATNEVGIHAATISNSPGVVSLAEGSRDLFVLKANNVRESIQYHAQPMILNIVKGAFWRPISPLVFRYCNIEKPYLKQVENWLIATRHPIFNVPRNSQAA